jgi:hypothetical protein
LPENVPRAFACDFAGYFVSKIRKLKLAVHARKLKLAVHARKLKLAVHNRKLKLAVHDR